MERKHVPLVAAGLVVAALYSTSASPADTARMERFRSHGPIAAEAAPAQLRRANEPQAAPQFRPRSNPDDVSEALTGFDNKTNGFTLQGPPFDSINEDNVVPLRSFNDNRFIFEEVETVADGLGTDLQRPELPRMPPERGDRRCEPGRRASHGPHGWPDVFFESLGGSLIQSRATHASIVERVAFEDDVRTFRISTNTLGSRLRRSDREQHAARDPRPPARRHARHGARWCRCSRPTAQRASAASAGRAQHASLESFSADAYLNEMGITTPLFPEENTSSGEYVGFGSAYDRVADPEDDGVDVVAFADFMRATKAPSRGPITANVRAGEQVFSRIGCAGCHVPSITTAPPGTLINGDALRVARALGNKVIHPYSDFLLHDVGTGDGIPFLPTPEFASTASQIRTAPLWALRTRNRLMHDGSELDEGRGDPAPCRPGGAGDGGLQRPDAAGPGTAAGVPRLALADGRVRFECRGPLARPPALVTFSRPARSTGIRKGGCHEISRRYADRMAAQRGAAPRMAGAAVRADRDRLGFCRDGLGKAHSPPARHREFRRLGNPRASKSSRRSCPASNSSAAPCCCSD